MKILISDAQDLFCDAVVAMVARHSEAAVVETVRTLDEVSRRLHEGARYDLVIVDVPPAADGVDPVIRLKAQFPSQYIAIMSSGLALAEVLHAVGEGISGFIPKDRMSGAAFMAALELIRSGETFMPVSLIRETRALQDRFSNRELLVLQRVRVGFTNKQIANDIGVDENTVKNSVRNLRIKLNARNRTEIALKAMGFRLPELAPAGTGA